MLSFTAAPGLLAWYSVVAGDVIVTFAGTVLLPVLAVDAGVTSDAGDLRGGAAPLVARCGRAGAGGFDLDLPLDDRPALIRRPAAACRSDLLRRLERRRGDLTVRPTVAFTLPHRRVPDARGGGGSCTVAGAGGALGAGRPRPLRGATPCAFAATAARARLAALLVSLAGGWFPSARPRPMARINRAAADMAGGNLEARIAVERTENELEQVAQALNGASTGCIARRQPARFTADASHELRTPLATLTAEERVGAGATPRGRADYRQTVEICQRATQPDAAASSSGSLTLARGDNLQRSSLKLCLCRSHRSCASLMPIGLFDVLAATQ